MTPVPHYEPENEREKLMARRQYSYSPQCVHEGCAERANYVFSTRRDYADETRRLRERGGWRCVRHSKPNEVLSVLDPARTHTLVVKQLMWESKEGPKPLGLFWCAPGSESGSGFTYGPGFKAFAEDFPEGTVLSITARVVPPAPVHREEGKG